MQLLSEWEEGSGDFCGDPDRLQQVIWNLLANAIKFTPRDGRVVLRVHREHSQVEVSVTDTGVGIAPDFLPLVFDRFRQADSSITRTQGGLGLGLAIVRHLVEVHGGTVHAESEGEGKGARFTVRMPVRAVAPQAIEAAAPDSEPPLPEESREIQAILQGLHVLVVDDDPDARDLVAAVLANHGASVRTVSSVDEAIVQLREKRPDVLLSDIGLPSEDGYMLMRRVREIDSSVPAAALTAYAGPTDHQRALDAGFQAHVTKPVEPADLALLVASLAGRTPSEVRPVPPEVAATVAAG